MRFVVIAAVSLFVALSGVSRAQTPAYTEEHLGLAREVVALSGAERAMTDMLDVMAPQMADMIVTSGATREFANRFVELFREEFLIEAPRMMEMISVGYAGVLTVQELRDARDFYASPSGRALVARTSELNATMSRVGETIGQEIAQRALARMEAERGQQRQSP